MSEQADTGYGRAGRNLPVATVVGVALFSIFAASIWFKPVVFALLVAFVMMLAVVELARAISTDLPAPLRKVLLLCAPSLVLSAYFGGPQWLLGAFVISIGFVLVARLFSGQEDYVSHASKTIFIISYAPLLASFAVLLAAQEDGAKKVFALVLLTIGADIGGYFIGIFFGKHPLAPKISPKKSWEGLIGAIVLEIAIGIAIWHLLFEQSWWKGAIVGAVLAVTATFGDLIESIIKRDIGIKDMSQLIPGHGGIMDRLDSLVLNAVVAWLLFGLFV